LPVVIGRFRCFNIVSVVVSFAVCVSDGCVADKMGMVLALLPDISQKFITTHALKLKRVIQKRVEI
jgi:hypothetical protein